MATNTHRTDNWNFSGLQGRIAAVSIDVWLLLLMTAGFNLHLLGMPFKHVQVFLPSAIADGQWWRIISHPFVHVSRYHLLLDAGAFFLLYRGLNGTRVHERLLIFLFCSASSLIAAVLFVSEIDVIGLCGLSGVAHGLMAFSGLEMMQVRGKLRNKHFAIGLVSFLVVALKSVIEFMNGEVMFAFMHMGLCGTPVAACHLGGVIGGVAAYILRGLLQKRAPSRRIKLL